MSVDTNYLGDIDEFCKGMMQLTPLPLNTPIQAGYVLVYQVTAKKQHMTLAISGEEMIHTWPTRGAIISSHQQSKWRNKLIAIYRYDA
jgi:hypothetical protein